MDARSLSHLLSNHAEAFLFFIGNVMETNLVEASFILEDKRLSVQVRKLSDRNRDHNIDKRKELTVEMATIGSPPHANTD